MFLKNTIIFSTLVAALPLSAQAWEHSMERGVDLYRVVDNGVAVSLVCDPRSVYGTTESAVLVQLGAAEDATTDATFRFPDGIVVQAAIVRGRIAKAATQGGAWEPLLTGFRAHSAVQVTAGERMFDVNLGDPMAFSCL